MDNFSGRLSSRVFYGFGAVGLNFVLVLAERVSLVPLLSMHWGKAVLGDWLVILSAGMFIGSFIAGFPTHAANAMTQEAAHNNWNAVNRAYAAGMVLTVSVCGIAMLLFLAGNSFFHLRETLGVEALSSHQTVYLLLIFLVFNMLVLVLSLPSQAYRAFGMFARGHMIGNTRQFVLLLVLIIAIFFGLEPLGAGLLYLASLAIDTAFLSLDLPKRAPALKLSLHYFSLPAVRGIFKDGFLFNLLMIGPSLSMQGNILLASSILGTTTVLGYILMRTLINIVSTALFSFGRVLWPEIAHLHAAGDTRKNSTLNVLLIKSGAALGCALAAFLLVCGRDLLVFWSRVDNVIDPLTVGILTISVLSRGFYGGSSIFCIALNRHQVLASLQLIGGLSTVLLTPLLTGRYGLNGTAIAFAVPDVLCSALPSLLISSRLSGLVLRELSRQVLMPLLWFGILSLCAALLVYRPSVAGLSVRLLFATALYFPLAAMLLYKVVFTREEQTVLRKALRFSRSAGQPAS